GKLELTWVGKYDDKVVEPRILVEDKEKSYGDPDSENMLIHGDNLIALKALQQEYAGKVRCIFIDPPYNTGAAFEAYDDNVEHSIWLSLMKSRLVLLHELLADNGTIFIQIDDNEQAYLKVLCDEIFGRQNFINMVSVNAKVSAGASGGGEDKRLKKNIEYILIYVKDMNSFEPFHPVYKRTELMTYIQRMKEDGKSFKYTTVLYRCQNKKYFKTIKDGAGDDIVIERVLDYETKSVKQVAQIEGITEEEVYEKYYDKIMTTTNAQTSIRTRVWDATDSENNMYIATYTPKTGKDKGTVKELIFMGKQKVLVIWLKDTAEHIKGKIYKKERVGTYWDGFSWINVTKEGGVLFPMGKKPESLLKQILEMATDVGDLVLDSFLGSGTTAAVAHKLKRRWIGIELGVHAYSHCKVRLDKVVDGTDQGGISKEEEWQGGGGYHFYELAPSLLVRNKKLPIYQINPEYTFEMLCEAICKLEGFRYKPEGVFHGYSSEKRFIHITEEFINAEYVKTVTTTLGESQSLLIYGAKVQSDLRLPDNIEVKRIPKDLLEKCEFESEVR
ncbi:MAG: site-specific DNA-methyltransferase, partial [Ruminococcus flavefaciens]|nr:site-specific DNA-methyltransferase [Ruminococcus flavefaciens]